MNAPMDSALTVAAVQGAKGNLHNISCGNYTFSPISVVPDNIPEVLRRRCCVWKAEFDLDSEGKPKLKPNGKPCIKKAPLGPNGGYNISVHKVQDWAPFERCVEALETGRYSGIGMLMQANSGLVGIDLDGVNELRKKHVGFDFLWARAMRDGVYAERSPSNSGARLFVRGTLPKKGYKVGGIELYAAERHLTLTGQTLWSGEVKEAQWFVDGLLDIIGANGTASDSVVAGANSGTGKAESQMVEELAVWAMQCHSRLWEGRWADSPGELGGTVYPSQSEADMALIGILSRESVKRGLAKPDDIAATVLAAFQQSALYRPEKQRQVEQYALPKAITSALESVSNVSGDSTAVSFATSEPGDITAGKLYADFTRNKLLYVAQAGRWLLWDEIRWQWCSCGEEVDAAKRIAERSLQWAASLCASDADRHKRRMAFAMRLQNLPRLEAMIELAKSETGMTVGHMTELDSDPWLIGVRNGVVNLKGGTLLAADPAMRITRQLAAGFDREAGCPRWLEFLDQIFGGDQDTISFLQRALGYTLGGSTTEEVLFICYGFGANGKSVFGNVVATIIGDYGQVAPPSLLTLRRDGDSGPRNDIARLCGARHLSINELQQGDRLDEQVVKMLAGREMLSARFLHKEFFDFWPTAKAWLRTNHRPIITGEDDGIWRRIMLIPFRRKFAESERDPWLEQRLLEERDGILAWMVEGCLQWQRVGLKPSQLVRGESGAYRKESDLMGEFLSDKTDIDPGSRIEQLALYRQYRQWCEDRGVRPSSKASLSRKFSERGFSEARSNGSRYYAGLKWKAA
jgi:putative DNA primase/helicase